MQEHSEIDVSSVLWSVKANSRDMLCLVILDGLGQVEAKPALVHLAVRH